MLRYKAYRSEEYKLPTKNYKSILHFYIGELGMDFWCARLFKKL